MSEPKEPQEAREFWIYRNEEYAPTYACDFNQRGFVPSKNRESIHVIEYSEYEKLQKENDKLKNYDIASLEVMLEELKKENAILRKALEFYASGDYWGYEHPSSDIFNSIDSRDLGIGDFQLSEDADDDGVGGRTAREALEKVK